VVHWLVIIGEPLYLCHMVLCRTIRSAIEHVNHLREPPKNQTGLNRFFKW